MVAQATVPAPVPPPAEIRVALAGNPNCGKTTLFNALTGARQHVGNYPGVTVERRVGSCQLGGRRAEMVDLPGTYSLTSFSPEERVAQHELTGSDHDVVVVVADSTCLKRNLVLLAQVMQMGANPVLCLNMADEARAAGQQIDLAQMERLLGFPVVETVGHRRQGIDELRQAILRAAHNPVGRHRLVLGGRLDRSLAAVREKLPPSLASSKAADWLATKLLVADPDQLARMRADVEGAPALAEAERQQAWLEGETGLDVSLLVTERYFGFVDGLLREVVTQAPRADARAASDRLDAILAHRWLGLPIFAAVMYVLFWLTFRVGEIPMGWLESLFAWLGEQVSSLWPEGSESNLRSLLVDGVIGGVGGVVVFLPNIVLLFAGLALLEDTGYMARAAFLTDRLMHRFGLHGKSFIPMMTGFGCTVPGVMATRTLENERDRLTTMLVLPLMSCGARLPIWMLLIPAFFPAQWRAPMLFAIYATGVVLALLLALLLRKSLLRGEEAPFVMELPPYRAPTLRGALTKTLERGWLYLRKAGTVILGISVLLWALTSYPKAGSYQVDAQLASGEIALAGSAAPGATPLTEEELAQRRRAEDLQASIAGRAGRALEPLFAPLGFDWKIVTAMLGAFAAKEVFVAQMGIVYAVGESDGGAESLREAIARDYDPLTGFGLMLFLLVATPCMATIAVTRRESGGWRWALLQLGGLTAIAYLLALLVQQVGRLFI
ncbi:MAG: ferrous iron transport protein B [Myxococcales bacterium]|jgi:ferrous iron transport protein B